MPVAGSRPWLQKIKSWFGWGGAEGSWRGPFMGIDATMGGSWHTLDSLEHPFQRSLVLGQRPGIAALHAAVAAYVNAFVVMIPSHVREHPNGGYEKVTNSALSRWLRRPNGWQTFAEFMSGMIGTLMTTGNAVAVVARNDRTEVQTAVQASGWSVYVDPESGGIFYGVTLNDGVTRKVDYMVPARDVLHLRINTTAGSPLQGRSPVEHCASSLVTNAQLSAFLNAYLANRASPSYALTTDANLTADQMRQLRTAWADQSKLLASGGTPILASGLKPVPLGVAPGDTLLADTFRLSVEDIARAFSIPRALLGIDETASNAEQLLRSWVSLGLGSMVEMVEQSIERLFELGREEFVEFDANSLLRLDAAAQVEMVARGVVSGIYSIDEGRARLGMMPVEGGYGAMPTQQQQQVPLNVLSELHTAAIASKLRAAEPKPEPAAAPEPKPEEAAPSKNGADPEIVKALVVDLFAARRKSS